MKFRAQVPTHCASLPRHRVDKLSGCRHLARDRPVQFSFSSVQRYCQRINSPSVINDTFCRYVSLSLLVLRYSFRQEMYQCVPLIICRAICVRSSSLCFLERGLNLSRGTGRVERTVGWRGKSWEHSIPVVRQCVHGSPPICALSPWRTFCNMHIKGWIDVLTFRYSRISLAWFVDHRLRRTYFFVSCRHHRHLRGVFSCSDEYHEKTQSPDLLLRQNPWLCWRYSTIIVV